MTPVLSPADVVAFVQRLAKSETDAIGFLVRCAIRRHADAGLVRLAYDEGQPVGFLIHSPLRVNKVARVHQVCIARANRRRGHGAALYAQFRQKALDAGCRCVSLCCAEDLAGAGAFWLSQGLVPVAVQDRSNRRCRAVRYYHEPLQPCLFTVPPVTRPGSDPTPRLCHIDSNDLPTKGNTE